MKNRPLHERLGFAVAGIRSAMTRESSFRTQVGVALIAITALIVLRPVPIWWAVVILTAALVLALELINSAVEGLIDLLHPAIHPEIKVIKDMLAGAVLVISIAALAIGAALATDTLPMFLASFQGTSR